MFEKTSELERMAIFLLRQEGWTVQPVENKNYRLDLFKPGSRVATTIQEQKRRVTVGQIEKFTSFLESSSSANFSEGLVISTSGFSPSVYSFLREEEVGNVSLAVIDGYRLIDASKEFAPKKEIERPIYIGVFTCKGGVGKTTISAHLGGAFATNGYDVALVDLDRQENLRKILGDGVHVAKKGEPMGSVVSVFNTDEWDEQYHRDTKVVICDCNPEFDANPKEYMRRFDYCIIPTTLNPLGINKNGDVIKRTLKMIRQQNSDARLFVLINNLQKSEEKRNDRLNKVLKEQIEKATINDHLSQYIDPSDASIRFSKQLLYWGYHLFEDGKPELAFKQIGRYSYPRVDFLNLVDFLEEKTVISMAKGA